MTIKFFPISWGELDKGFYGINIKWDLINEEISEKSQTMINEFKHVPFLSKHTIKADVEWFLKSHSNFVNPQTSVNNINESERKSNNLFN